MVDKLLLNNGYTSKVIRNIREKGKKRKNCKKKRDGLRNQQGTYSVLKLPYINDVTSRKFKQAIKSSGLPVRLIETPGQNLRGLLTEIKIKDIGKNLKNRKIKEAKFISQKQPSLNDKQEFNDLTQFLV